MTDWSVGEYERTAARLEPAAEVAVGALAPRAGERILDVGTGTGNAALLAARSDASVVGVDPAARLLDVARERAAQDGLNAEFVSGDAADLPFEDDAFDAAISVFGVIFADAKAAAAELVRVVRPGGRVVLTTWVPSGPVHEMGTFIREAFGAPPEQPVWSDPDVVRGLFDGHEVGVEIHEIQFTAADAEEYMTEHRDHHPMWIEGEEPMRRAGIYDKVDAHARELFTAANEDPDAFRITSRYHLVQIRLAG